MTLKNEGNVEVVIDGVTYKSVWKVDKGTITVPYANLPPKVTHVGSGKWPPTDLAKMLLTELIHEHLKNKKP